MMTEVADSGPECLSGVSERKARANAENARRSTGPRTAAGKRKSSMNALKYGGFATMSVAIRRGAFVEDPDELGEYLEGIVDALAPRDALEREEAQRIAQCYLRSRRLVRYEAEILSPADPSDPLPRSSADPVPLEERLANAHAFGRWLVEGIDDGLNFDDILRAISRNAGLLRHLGLECEDEPEGYGAWDAQARVEWHIEHVLGGHAEARSWLTDLVIGLADDIHERDAAVCSAARASMADTDRVSVTSQRNARELERALRQYQILQQRALPGTAPTRNEPTDT
jgi:hypothetical protein